LSEIAYRDFLAAKKGLVTEGKFQNSFWPTIWSPASLHLFFFFFFFLLQK